MTRVGERLNQALHELFTADNRLFLLGEDVADPYGGAFGITRGLSTAFPDRIYPTPISEAGIVGAAGGLALCGDRVIVEVMFGDFVTLAFDPIVNFISKSVTMYGATVPMRVVIRCPVGGNRGYGPTHSQNLQKHLLGVPNLALYELSPVHDPGRVLVDAMATGIPAVFFEDKVLYTQPIYLDGEVDGLLRVTPLSPDGNWVSVGLDADEPPDRVVIAPGGVAPRVLSALRTTLIEDEIAAQLLVPARLCPLDLEPVLPILAAAPRILLVEDGVAGGGWTAELARRLYERLWGRLREPIRVLQPRCDVIPAAPHLERELLVQDSDIHQALR
ncbi:transketolase C-terminal domain-containing protein [Micromonospora sp. NPDC005652]|uniref:alpha-ketoacid dehydrogenase subunit beta n=1 Tax=Micromonospora sp. NPDC005652 TaxID=3157046 RepID=UPI003403F243